MVVALAKPQFEAGRRETARGKGVVRDEAIRAAAVDAAAKGLDEAGLRVLGRADSVLAGPKGNREVFLYARREDRC